MTLVFKIFNYFHICSSVQSLYEVLGIALAVSIDRECKSKIYHIHAGTFIHCMYLFVVSYNYHRVVLLWDDEMVRIPYSCTKNHSDGWKMAMVYPHDTHIALIYTNRHCHSCKLSFLLLSKVSKWCSLLKKMHCLFGLLKSLRARV